MITDKNINSIYKSYNKHDDTLSANSLKAIWSETALMYKVQFTDEDIIINSFEPTNPFHTIPIQHIYSVLSLDRHILIIMPACIIFFNKQDNNVSVHLRPVKQNIFSRFLQMFKNK